MNEWCGTVDIDCLADAVLGVGLTGLASSERDDGPLRERLILRLDFNSLRLATC